VRIAVDPLAPPAATWAHLAVHSHEDGMYDDGVPKLSPDGGKGPLRGCVGVGVGVDMR
jgi:hypothetical protein